MADWAERVQRLPEASVEHIAIAFRARHAQIWPECLEGMAAKLPGYCLLEESRTKLLFDHFPRCTYGPKELQERFDLWMSGAYEVLLSHAEAQDLLRRDECSRRKLRRTGNVA